MAEVKDKLITVESAKAIHDSLNSKFNNVVYSSEDDSEASSVPVNADTLGGVPASEYATKDDLSSVEANAVTESQVSAMINDVRYSPVLNLSTVDNVLAADMLGKTIMCRTADDDFVLTVSKEVHDLLPVGFEFALVFWDTANSVKLAFTGGVYACIAGEGSIENATLALPERFTMVAAKKVTSKSWLVTGNVEVV